MKTGCTSTAHDDREVELVLVYSLSERMLSEPIMVFGCNFREVIEFSLQPNERSETTPTLSPQCGLVNPNI